MNETTNFDCNKRKQKFNRFLMKPDPVDSPYDTESTSTSSSELDLSYSKESLSSREFEDFESPLDFSQRALTLLSCDNEESSWNELPFSHDDDQSCSESSSKNRKRFHGTLRLTWMKSLVVLAVTLSLMKIGWKPTLNRTREWSRWRHFLHNDSPKLMKDIQAMPTGSTFTIRLKGSRMDLMKQSLDSHSLCSSVEEIQIDFQGDDDSFPNVLLRYGAGKATRNLEKSTTGIFLLKEGVTFSCDELDNAFRTWKKDPRRIVGFFGFPSGNTSSNVESWNHGTMVGPYSIVSDRAAFIHSHYLDALAPFSDEPCCENLLSVQVSLASRMPPLLMKTNPRQIVDTTQTQSMHLGSDQDTCYERCQGHISRISGLHSLPNSDASILLGSR